MRGPGKAAGQGRRHQCYDVGQAAAHLEVVRAIGIGAVDIRDFDLVAAEIDAYGRVALLEAKQHAAAHLGGELRAQLGTAADEGEDACRDGVLAELAQGDGGRAWVIVGRGHPSGQAPAGPLV